MKFYGDKIADGRLPWLSKALTLLLLISLNQNFLFPQKSVAAEQQWITSKLTIAPGGVVSAKFDTQKDVPLFISIQGTQRTSASGFTGVCKFFGSDGKEAFNETAYSRLKFKDEEVNYLDFKPSYSGSYLIECKNESASEAAVVELSYFSIRNISNQNQGVLKVPALSIRILRFALQKDIFSLISVKGSQRITDSGFTGECIIYRGDGERAYKETNYNTLNFKDESINHRIIMPTYTGDYFLICANKTNKEAKVSFAVFNTSSVVSSSNLLINIPGIEIKALRFNGQKDEIVTITATGGARTNSFGFTGKCIIYRGDGETAYKETNYNTLNFKDQTTNNIKFTAAYTGAYFLVCSNNNTGPAKIQFGGISNLNELKSSNTFFGYSDQSTQNSQPTPSPTSGTSTGQGDVTAAIDLTLEAQGSVKKIETGNFTSADILRALEAANKAVEIANKALKAASSADGNSSQARSTAEKALDEAKKVQQLARSMESANKSIGSLKSAVRAITNTVNAMTIESACRDKRANLSAGASIVGNALSLLPVFGNAIDAGLGITADINDLVAIKQCKGK